MNHIFRVTLKPFDNVEKSKYICLTDVNDAIYNKAKSMTDSEIKVMTHTVDPKENSKLTWEKRFKNVEELLKTYQGAKCVITTRLHVILPCLALGTPVLLIDYPEYKTNDRFGTYMEYVNHLTQDEFLNDMYDVNNPPSNPTRYLEINSKIEKNVIDFIEKSKNITLKPEISKVDYENIYVKRVIGQQNIANKVYSDCKEEILQLNKKINEMNKIINNLKDNNSNSADKYII